MNYLWIFCKSNITEVVTLTRADWKVTRMLVGKVIMHGELLLEEFNWDVLVKSVHHQDWLTKCSLSPKPYITVNLHTVYQSLSRIIHPIILTVKVHLVTYSPLPENHFSWNEAKLKYKNPGLPLLLNPKWIKY